MKRLGIARRLGVAGLALWAVGCSGLKPYPNDLTTKNVAIRTTANAGSMFSSVRVELDVHGADAASCGARYLGTLQLDRSPVALGIVPERGSVLTFRFLSAGFLGSSHSSVSRAVFIAPGPDQRYEIDVSYRDDLYDVVVRERLRSGALREVTAADPRTCSSR